MHRVLLDSNVLASALAGFHQRDSVTVRVLKHMLAAESVIVISNHIHAEIGRALASPIFRDRMTAEERMWAYKTLSTDPFYPVIPVEVDGIASHPEDDVVLGTALAGRAEYLVTSDKALLRLGTFEGIAIVSPPQFLALIESDT